MSSTVVRLADVVPFSWVDGPGNRFVVFVQGCPFDCLACHNPGTIPPRGISHRVATVEELLKQVRLVEPFLDASLLRHRLLVLVPAFIPSGAQPVGQPAGCH